MGRCIVKVKDRYAEWSTIVDAPVSTFVARAEAVKEWGAERIARCDTFGDSFTSFAPGGTNDFRCHPEFNRAGPQRAGPQEECLTIDGLLAMYSDLETNQRLMHDGVPPEWIVPPEEDVPE